jgi:hypothetical protein
MRDGWTLVGSHRSWEWRLYLNSSVSECSMTAEFCEHWTKWITINVSYLSWYIRHIYYNNLSVTFTFQVFFTCAAVSFWNNVYVQRKSTKHLGEDNRYTPVSKRVELEYNFIVFPLNWLRDLSQMCTNPGRQVARSPGRPVARQLNYVQWRLISVCLRCGRCFVSAFVA